MINLFKKPYKKKAGKFQPFKKLFGRRKKREPASECEEPKLKPSHSFGNICNGSSSDEEPGSGLRSSHYSMGSRAFSHDSIFIPDGRTESEQAIQAMSQENVLGKVKILQQQLAKNIKFGQPPQMTVSARTMGEANASPEEDALLSSSVEMETQQDTVISDCGNKSTDTPDFLRKMNFLGTGHEMEEKITPVKSARPKRQFSCSGTIETINLDSVPQALARLDNSAAKHKLSVKPKKQRMSRQHKRLTKGSQSLTITEFEPEDLETQLYEDLYPSYNGRFTAGKLIQDRDEQKLAEEKRIEDHWGILEAERIRQIVEMEEQREMEEKRCQELEEMRKEQEKRRCEEERRQYLLEGETSLKIEEKTCHKEERRLMKAEKRQELEEQMQKELEEQQRQDLEEKRRWEVKEQQRQELEVQKLKEQEEQQRRELEEQKLKEREEQQRQELEVQKLKEQEDQQRQELEEKKLKEREEQQRQELEVQKLKEQEEQQKRESEEQKLKEQEEQQRQELEVQKLKEREEQQKRESEEQKLKEQEEKLRQELEVQKFKEQEEQQRRELDEQWQQQGEEQQRLKQEEEKHQELEEQQRRELEEQKHQEQEEQRHQELEEEKCQEWEEQKHKDLEEKQRRELEEQKRLALEELRQHRSEKDSQKEEERNWLEEQKELKKQNKEEIQQQELEEKELEEVEIKLKQEKEPESLKQEKKQEEQRQHLKEKEKTEKGQPQQVTDKKKKREEQRKHKLTKQMHMESSDFVLQDELKQQKEPNGHEWNKLKEQKVDTEGPNLHPKQEKSLEQPQEKDQLCSAGVADTHPAEEKLQEGSSSQKVKQPEKGTKTAEEILAQKLKREVEAQEQKRIGEELRWQEVDERQTASRPFTFQVSSGDKQIIFQKVNLSPVMPIKGTGLSSPSVKDCRVHTTSKGSHSLPSSVCVPHTAILVTGAQLCGTAVNLNQIKDTACKSLLGLTEERKNVDIPSPEKSERKKQDPKPSSSKMKHAQEALNNQAVMAEWASIRSRILKNAENNKYNEKDRVAVCRHSDDWTPRGRGAPHGNLRKTLSANAKFSITPAWQKFSDVSKTNSDAENVNVSKGNETLAVGRTTGSSADSKEDVASTFKDNLAEKLKEKMETHREVTDNTEGCKFAKDLPSFLVPSFPHSVGKDSPQPELPNSLENQQNNSTKKADKPSPNGEENVSPFGIKLRRTNYSLRFHYDQQAEQKKKKRYSAGDSFDGVPDPLTSTEGEKESSVFTPQESTSPGTGRANIPGNLKDSSVTVVFSPPVGTPVVPPATGQSALPAHEKPACKSLVPQKPALAPKPTSQTPPSSPLSKMNRSNLSEMLGQRVAKAESDGGWRKEDRANAAQPIPSNDYKNEEEEVKEKKSFFPSLSIPWREKNDKKPEPLKKEKPVLQSRHSLDGSKLLEKVETSQPLWITLALQKQKGFREQQATREERRQAREAKQAEKLAKENAAVSNQSDNKSSSSKTNTLQKSTTQEGEKKIETAVSRLERREHLKKSNTLPTSVTVEISDSVPSTPVTKEVAKRFSTPDANPVSTEPAWLALAKRKAKAWSDCPQIIK
ncbi:uncharacterized protein KIAA1211 homolog isoform X1 [Cyanistes caeruleus]|nr:uncharacterized protein KIAA1211 homolog isoform X1 [Cyanistes caeruleus]XP_023780952.1 uncharacterized protein KIAA1211 homolog isoform X1 [Cyanistes caeruleus]XP_023780953.1 uncharacterized protein KIAA1211 homolog isoform X1 [Cyanistes caeruleus]XP_023780954.1 uncharacterized protein KIAA1211 homolog isoform X1 [Cyanistes caeruleus]XP_023780955.1 uncharacterized protein KIAA1211 homolog isoform X1 [Cyanistes caeruleus]XP_023780956.1 uncharacterized protein KIAA1211 homolog isoform X1 [Cy